MKWNRFEHFFTSSTLNPYATPVELSGPPTLLEWILSACKFPAVRIVLGRPLGSLTIPRDPSIQIIPTLGPKVCKYYLHWAIWIPRVFSLFGFIGTQLNPYP